MKKISQVKVSISFKWVVIAAHAILIAPILIFFIGWLKWYIGLLFSAVLLSGAVYMIKKDYWNNSDKLELPVLHVALITIVFGLWIAYSGSCGIGVSNYDTPWRTACLRDLIDFDWPVYYPENDTGLCYYLIFWMVPSLFGKFLGMGGAFFVQWIWMLLIVLVSFLLISYLFKDYRAQILWLICSFMVLWSGINNLGTILIDIIGWNPPGATEMRALEDYCSRFANGESFNFLYRCNDEYLKQVYNQLPIIICVPLFLQNRKIHNFAFWGLILFPFSPWGTIGLGILMVIDAVNFIMNGNLKQFIKEAFSVQNISAIFSVFIIFVLFFSANSRTGATQGGGVGIQGGSFGIITLSKFDFPRIFGLVVFWLCEFGIYFAIMWRRNKRDYNFRVLLPVLMLIPFFWVGTIWGRDFCMNVSLPVLFILMIYMIEYVKGEVLGKTLTGKNFILIVCLTAAATTPVFDWAAKAKTMIAQKTIIVQNDSFYTYSNRKLEEAANQVAGNPAEALFYNSFAKPFKNVECFSENLSEIKGINDINAYFDYLIGKDCTVYIAVRDIPGFSLQQETVDRMKQLGFNDGVDILLQREYHSFIGITNNGKMLLQQFGGDEPISQSTEVDGYPVRMASATFNKGNYSNIIVKGKQYSVNGRGLNIVVRDNITGCIIDSVCFDTHVEDITCTR